MDLKRYKVKKALLAGELAESSRRALCRNCRKATSTCYCARIVPFDSGPRFVLLIHPKENRKRVGTGRLTHLCLRNSVLVEGVDFTNNPVVNGLLDDPSNWPVVLYPGPSATDISQNGGEKMEALVPSDKSLVVFVIDGSWSCAKKMLRLSTNLHPLPQIKFTPPHKSRYQIRRQPDEICFASVEAVHFMIDQLKSSARWPTVGHEALLEVFSFMICQQLAHAPARKKAIRGNRKAAARTQA